MEITERALVSQSVTEVKMTQWMYCYERSIGCGGVSKDWLILRCARALWSSSKGTADERG